MRWIARALLLLGFATAVGCRSRTPPPNPPPTPEPNPVQPVDADRGLPKFN